MQEKVGAHVIVYGRVQGVFFRAQTQRTAALYGVSGWVRNKSDGSVELLAEGSKPDVVALVGWCKKGPPAARVERVDITWQSYGGGFDTFDVRP
ncbi:MAG: acylphosphatase [Desulfosarcina sp.]